MIKQNQIKPLMTWMLVVLLGCLANASAAGQLEKPLANSVKALMQRSISDKVAPKLFFSSKQAGEAWLADMSKRLQKRMPDQRYREDFLTSVHYEASRAGLDPQLVLSLIQIESAFNKYAISSVRARGYMQVMPFWVRSIGASDHNLFDLRLNLRYGCTILRHYLDIEKGDLFRALGRYNGSLGKAKYPNLVLGVLRKYWQY